MKENSQIGDLLSVSLEKLKTLVDSSTVVGDPIKVDEVTIVPVSRVNFGFGAGGSDIPTSKANNPFGGGAGGGVTITPIGFLVVDGTNVRMIQPKTADCTADRIVNMLPDVAEKLGELIHANPKASK